MMKLYRSQEDHSESSSAHDAVSLASSISKVSSPDNDELIMRNAMTQGARLSNPEVLSSLPLYLSILPDDQYDDVMKVIFHFLCLFIDIPSQTSIITHDIFLTNPTPLKQHVYQREVMKKEVHHLVQTTSSSPWSSSCLLDTKSDGSPRLTVINPKKTNFDLLMALDEKLQDQHVQ